MESRSALVRAIIKYIFFSDNIFESSCECRAKSTYKSLVKIRIDRGAESGRREKLVCFDYCLAVIIGPLLSQTIALTTNFVMFVST